MNPGESWTRVSWESVYIHFILGAYGELARSKEELTAPWRELAKHARVVAWSEAVVHNLFAGDAVLMHKFIQARTLVRGPAPAPIGDPVAFLEWIGSGKPEVRYAEGVAPIFWARSLLRLWRISERAWTLGYTRRG